MTKQVLEKDVEVNFRTSLVRSTLLVDTTPSYESVEKYYHHLLAECESMAVSTSTMTPSTTMTPPTTPLKPEPKIKPMRTDNKDNVPTPPPPPRAPSQERVSGEEGDKATKAATPCKFYGYTFKGCARGTKCPFKHSWEGNEKEKSGRCWTCGGKGPFN